MFRNFLVFFFSDANLLCPEDGCVHAHVSVLVQDFEHVGSAVVLDVPAPAFDDPARKNFLTALFDVLAVQVGHSIHLCRVPRHAVNLCPVFLQGGSLGHVVNDLDMVRVVRGDDIHIIHAQHDRFGVAVLVGIAVKAVAANDGGDRVVADVGVIHGKVGGLAATALECPNRIDDHPRDRPGRDQGLLNFETIIKDLEDAPVRHLESESVAVVGEHGAKNLAEELHSYHCIMERDAIHFFDFDWQISVKISRQFVGV